MAVINEPVPLKTSFAENGDFNEIPDSNDGTEGLASWSLGFPEITQTPLAQGGLPPQRGDFNGIFKAITDFLRYYQAGGVFAYTADMDYKKNALVVYNNRLYYALSDNGAGTSNGQHLPTESAYWLPVPMPNVDNNWTTAQTVSGLTAKTGAEVNLSVANSVTVPNPSGDGEAVNKKYVDTVTGNLLTSNNTWTGTNTFSKTVDLGGATALNGATLTIKDSSGTAKATLNSSGYTGNAATATKLANARTINIQDATAANTGTGASFNGTANATIKLPATIKANLVGNVTGNVSGSSGSCTGNAATATQVPVLDFSGSSNNINDLNPTDKQRVKYGLVTEATLNTPTSASTIVVGIKAGWQGQLAISGYSGGGVWCRGCTAANTWGSWKRLLTSAISSYRVSSEDSWYVKFAGTPGFIIQGGYHQVQQTVTFPLAFPKACLNVQATLAQGDEEAAQTWDYTKTSFYLYQRYSSRYAHWVAFGY